MSQKKSYMINYDLYLECLQKFLPPTDFADFKKQLQDRLKKEPATKKAETQFP